MTIADGFDLLGQLDARGFVLLFWYTILFELPRYGFAAIAAFAISIANRDWLPSRGDDDAGERLISVLLPCHNEAGALRNSVLSLRDQVGLGPNTRVEIIAINDGSTDRTYEVANELKAEGLLDRVLSVEVRGGKSAATNLGLEYSKGEFVLITDADTTFDRHAFQAMLAPFRNPRVGAVSGNLYARNADATVVTRYQAVEYLVSIGLGRRIMDMLDTLLVVSGAFGVFRRSALVSVGGYDVEVGEDADLTMRLRRGGWKIRFAPDAWSLTDVPDAVISLVNQRMRWERSVVTIWVRKFRSIFDPRGQAFSLIDAFALFDLIFYQVILCIAFVVYAVWLFATFGQAALVVLAATTLMYVAVQLCLYVIAYSISAPYGRFGLIFYVPLFSIVNGYVMRFIRLYAYIDELAFRSSRHDAYVPSRVRRSMEQP